MAVFLRSFRTATAAGLLSVAGAGAGFAQDAALVGVDPVIVEPLAQTVPVIGRFVSRQSGTVAARVAGLVTKMSVQIGDRVARGQVLVVIDLERLTWQRDLARDTAAEMTALLAAATARFDKRRNELARLAGIRDSAAFSQARYDDTTQDAIEAEAAVAAATAVLGRVQTNLKLAEDDLRHARVRAPYDGVVSLRATEIGAYANVGSPVVSLINDTDLEVEADVPYNRIGGLAPGTVVTLRLDDASSHNAIVRAMGAEENPMSRTRLVRFTPAIENAKLPRAVGESVDVMLPLGARREVVTVHKDAVLKRQGLSLVYVIDADGAAQIRPVELGEAVGPRFVVLGGVSPGESVVVRGNERLRPGQSVRVGAEG
ncbi:MAG: efflux RND transporter periplasmic adaptor subunit [Alphaproteobacteria bacterium]|mgnify:CR=1 FL=1|jgi:RND family efflux transporter MFP subunit|nr:efflux RND transporter periplasmic adaptor subunit [Alphaproteobacteria bacterium]